MNKLERNYKVLSEILNKIDKDTISFLDGDTQILEAITIEYKGIKARLPLDFAGINNGVQYGLKDIIDEMKEYIDLSDKTPHIEFEDIEPIYTGGDIWCFLGELSDGNFFLASDFMDSFRILNEDPREKDEAWYPEWQEKHLVLDIDDDKTTPIFIDLYRWLESYKSDCGIDFQAEIIARQEEE